MDLGLLQKEHPMPFGAKKFGDHREHLAHSVAHVDDVPIRTLGGLAELPDLNLEGSTSFPQRLDRDFVEKAGCLPETLERRLQRLPSCSVPPDDA